MTYRNITFSAALELIKKSSILNPLVPLYLIDVAKNCYDISCFPKEDTEKENYWLAGKVMKE